VPRESIPEIETQARNHRQRSTERERDLHTQIFPHIETDREQENGVTVKGRTTGEDWSEEKHIIIRRAEFITSSSSSLLCAGNFIFTTFFFSHGTEQLGS
jgi:hypothetical protein